MKKSICLVLCSIALAFSTSGCLFLAAGAAGVGTAKWMSDKVTMDVDRPRDKVAEAAKETFADLKIKLTKETRASDVTQILGVDAQGRKVWVDVRPVVDNLSKVNVRVGWINGEDDAHAILEKIVQKAKSWI
jgi:hypothetical protein